MNKPSPVIEEAVERIMERTGLYREANKGGDASIAEVENWLEAHREYLRIELCKIAKASSLDANIAQHCSAYTVSH